MRWIVPALASLVVGCSSPTDPGSKPPPEPVWVNASGYYVAEGRPDIQVYLTDVEADPSRFETFYVRHDERATNGVMTMWSGAYRASEDSLYFVPTGHSVATWPKLSGASWSGRQAFSVSTTFGVLRLVKQGEGFPP